LALEITGATPDDIDGERIEQVAVSVARARARREYSVASREEMKALCSSIEEMVSEIACNPRTWRILPTCKAAPGLWKKLRTLRPASPGRRELPFWKIVDSGRDQ
jgi:hypothetical protein